LHRIFEDAAPMAIGGEEAELAEDGPGSDCLSACGSPRGHSRVAGGIEVPSSPFE
jgi:hypothetical protein